MHLVFVFQCVCCQDNPCVCTFAREGRKLLPSHKEEMVCLPFAFFPEIKELLCCIGLLKYSIKKPSDFSLYFKSCYKRTLCEIIKELLVKLFFHI